MKKAYWFLCLSILLACIIMLCFCTNVSHDVLFEAFQNPSADCRPFVRWWWNDNRVTAEETLREMDVMKAAGIGGFEINPIAADNTEEESRKITTPLEWLSPEWNEVLRATAEGARERGMIPDMIVGSGWPSGGRFLESGEQIQIITTIKKKLTGPIVFSESAEALMKGAVRIGGSDREIELEHGSEPRLVFLRLVPLNGTSFEIGADVMNQVTSGGRVELTVPEGEYMLYAGAWREGYRQVNGGVLGADGPVLDHYNAAVLKQYLNRISDTLNPVLGGEMGNTIRAMFFDSFELAFTNWTADLPEEFEKRRGYNPMPYLHFMVDLEPLTGCDAVVDRQKRLRYDFNLTLIELFMERFTATFTAWCHENGMKSRAQAYGREGHPLETSLSVDLPEGETWVWGWQKFARPSSINRFVASAAHLSGKSRISAESMTNPFTPFRVLPAKIKHTDDLSFISGITHSILHGYSYSPPEVGFPGWVRFGCYFNEQNSWWPYFKYWADYNARISSVLQHSEAQARVAILTPEADIWSRMRPYHPFAEREVTSPWYVYQLWQALHQNGFNVEYTSDRILQEAVFKNGKIHVRNRVYEILILEQVESLQPKTAMQLEKLARAGGKIAYVGQAPHRSPSLHRAEANDKAVRQSIQASLEANPDFVQCVDEPKQGRLIEWAGNLMEAFSVEPDVRFSSPSSQLSQIYHRKGDRDIFFIAWSDTAQGIDFSAEFNTGSKRPCLWNPETGERFLYPVKDKNNQLNIHFDAHGSMLLVFETEAPDLPLYKQHIPDLCAGTELHPQWMMTFDHAVTDDIFTLTRDELIDPGQSDDERLNRFAGTIHYTGQYTVDDTTLNLLDLGEVLGVSEVKLNGHELGVKWYGRHLYDVADALTAGQNILEIKVTTHLGNYVREAPRDTHAGRFSWWYPVESVGLLGPVRLCPSRQEF